MNKHKFNVFPEMNAEEFEQLKADIQVNGYDKRYPVYIYQGDVLDGWNRYRACEELKVEPVVQHFFGNNAEAIAFVFRTNKRRNLTKEQLACIAAESSELIEEVKKAVEEARRKKQKENAANQHTKPCAKKFAEAKKEVVRTDKIIADTFNTNMQYLRETKKLKEEKPEIFERVKSGETTLAEVKKEEKKEEQQKKVEVLRKKEVAPPTGKYDVIVIDPPWQMEKIERDVAPDQVGFDYPTMTIEEISKFNLPSEKDCHVFMWITHKHLPEGFEILKKWDAKYVCTFVWHKNGGFQPFGLPQYNCEFILYARIGTPSFVDLKSFNVCFSAERTGHSKKPDIFYETLKRVTAGKRIDIFNRRKIEGFETWGNEA